MPSTAALDVVATDADIAALRVQARRLAVTAWAFGLVGLTVTAAVQATAPGRVAWAGAAATTLAAPAAYALLVGRTRRIRRPAVLPPGGMPPGFVTAATPGPSAFGVFLLACAGLPLGAAARIGLILLAALAVHRPARVALLPGRVVVRRLRTRSVPWSQIVGEPAVAAGELSLAVNRPDGSGAMLRVPLRGLDVDPDFLRALVRHYLAVPEDRTAIGVPAELARRRAAHLAAGQP